MGRLRLELPRPPADRRCRYLSDTEGFKTYSRGAVSPPSPPLVPGKGLQIRQPNVPGAATSIIIVGSHDPTLRITIQFCALPGSDDRIDSNSLEPR